jgi:hypothetical protein
VTNEKHALREIIYGIAAATGMLSYELGYMEKKRNMSVFLNVVFLCVLNIFILLIF